MEDYYQILGITRNATPAEIKAAFKKMAILYHPDKNQGQKEAEEKFKQVNEAYQMLSDVWKKARYDQLLNYGNAPVFENPAHHTSTSSSGQGRYYYQRKTVRRQRKSVITEPNESVNMHLIMIVGFIVMIIASYSFYNRMNTYSSQKNYEEALQAFKSNDFSTALIKSKDAVVQDESNEKAFYLRGYLLLELHQDPKLALYAFTRAISCANPPKADYYYYRGKCYYEIGKFDLALLDFEKVFQIDSTAVALDNKTNLKLEALAFMAEIKLYKFQNYKGAIEYYKQLLEISPEDKRGLLGLGIAYYLEHEYEASMKFLTNVIEKDPEEGAAYYYLAYNNLYLLKDTANACLGWKDALNLGIEEARRPIKEYCNKKPLK